jgi:hypothetical protein
MMRKFLCVVVTLGASLSAFGGLAHAETGAAAGPSWQQNADKMAEARRRYDLGLKLYEDGNYEASRIEFERAMDLAPSYRILYNIGQAYKQLNNYVASVAAFERYISEGGAEVPEDRRTAVKSEIVELRKRIGTIRIVTQPGAEILVDGVVVGKAPLSEPLSVNPGLRRFGAQLSGHLPATKTITVGSSDNPMLTLQLEELPKTRLVERRSNPWVIPTVVGWAVTGVGAITAGVVGGLSLGARSDQEDLLSRQGVSAADLGAARDKTQALSTGTDIALIGTGLAAGASIFFTYKMLSAPKQEENRAAGPSVQVVPGIGSLMAAGTF